MNPTDKERFPIRHGTATEIEGQSWLLSPGVRRLDGVWDRLCDQANLRGQYEPDDVRLAGVRLLLDHYDLTPEEAVDLIRAAPLRALVVAVETAMWGGEKAHRTYTDWVLSSLYINGLKPEDIPPHLVLSVLQQLVELGKAVPSDQFISSAVARDYLAKIPGVTGPK